MNIGLVSIIIPTYNRVDLIGQTLDSVINQSYQHWECIIVDDGSTDETFKILNLYSKQDLRIKLYKRPNDRPKGANACRNYGFEISKGDYINWFDSDDIMHPDFIEKKVAEFKSDIDIIISKHELIGQDGNFIRKEERTRHSENLLEDFICLKVSWYLPDPIYRRNFLLGKKLFDEELFRGQDRDFHIRRLLEDPRIAFIDEYLTLYRQSEVSISNDFSPRVVKSNYNAIKKQIDLVGLKNSSKKIRLFYLRDQIKKYPYLWQIEGITKENYFLFYKLFFPGIEFIKWFIKYNLAVVSYKLFGKGHLFLKG